MARKLFFLGNLLSDVAGDVEVESRFWDDLRTLADDMNVGFDEYEVALLHLDTEDYLVFTPRSEA